jgi:hypothetical protein
MMVMQSHPQRLKAGKLMRLEGPNRIHLWVTRVALRWRGFRGPRATLRCSLDGRRAVF